MRVPSRQELGFDARGLTGRVVMGGPEDALTPRTHMFALVTLDGRRYIADVGFGGMVPTAPLLLDSKSIQPTPHEPYQVEHRQMDQRQMAQRDDHYLLRAQVAARASEGWRKTLRNGDFAEHRLGMRTLRRRLTDPDEVVAVLCDEFGIDVPQHPLLLTTIASLLAR